MSSPEPGPRTVTVGVPVRNGAETLPIALDALLRQTHRDLDIVICDNASDDATAEVARSYCERDDRVRYVRHPEPIPVIANWRSAFEEATTPYFMWASDDDLRNDRYVEALLGALDANPAAGLAFGRVRKFRRYGEHDQGTPYEFSPATQGISPLRRLFMDKHGPFSQYGVFRREVLDGYRWYDHTVSPDWPLFIYILLVTEIVSEPSAVFYYREGEVAVPHQHRAREQSYRAPETYLTVRLAWRCAQAARDAAVVRPRRRLFLADFAVVFAGLLWGNRRSLVANLLDDVRGRLRRRRAEASSS